MQSRNVKFWLLAVCCSTAFITDSRLTWAESAESPARNSTVSRETITAERMSALIDSFIATSWVGDSVVPAPIADDAEFLRRVSLDISGKIPHASIVRDFLADTRPDKRRRVVEDLLAGPSYIIHYTNLWRAALVPEAESDQQIRFVLPGFEAWLRSRIAENRNFAEIVYELLTLPIDAESVVGFNQPEAPTPIAFYRAKEAKPELLAGATARLFLGIRIDCAQCHDHPFDNWKQQQFWQHAAFFTDIDPIAFPDQAAPPDRVGVGQIRIPDKDLVVQAHFLGTPPEEVTAEQDPAADPATRSTLARWITQADNPYFAHAIVNRIWASHFGIGLVDPLDDFSPHNPASHPELLDALANGFVQSGFDIKFLIRAITGSQTYQRTSRQTDPSQASLNRYAKMPVRGMTPEQIFDSLAVSSGYRQPFDPEQPLNFNTDTARQEFLETFGNQTESPVERASTVLQALTLMNGTFVTNATDLRNSRTLAAIVAAPFLSHEQQVDALYLTTLSRLPTPAERSDFRDYLAEQTSIEDSATALADLFWVLLNSSEYLLNH